MNMKYSFVRSLKQNIRFFVALRELESRNIFIGSRARGRRLEKTGERGNEAQKIVVREIGKERREAEGDRTRFRRTHLFRATWLHHDVTMEVIGILGMSTA